MKKTIIIRRDSANGLSPTSGLQEAIDALPASGGTVLLPAGVYPLRRSVLLRSNVTLRGAKGPPPS